MNGAALAAIATPTSDIKTNVTKHKHNSEDDEFHLILDSIQDKAVRNQVYKDVVGMVNELNATSYDHHTLSSIALPSHQEILAIGGVTHDNFEHVSAKIMHLMQQRGYSTAPNAYAPPVQNLGSVSTFA